MNSFFRLTFLPRNTDLALLLLRVWLGGSMLVLHGWPKLQQLVMGNFKFADPIGIGEAPSLILAVSTEAVGSLLLILGLFGRLGALLLTSTMAVAFAMVHQMKLAGPQSGELAFVYLAGFLVILIAGSGKYAITPQS
jgi:putative oxidoreductase